VAILGYDEVALRRVVDETTAAGLSVVAQATSIADLTQACDPEVLDAFVVHTEQLGADELAHVRTLRDAFPEVGVVCVVSAVSGRAVRDAFAGLVDGIVLDYRLAESLPAAVRSACAGLLSVPRELRVYVGKPVLSAREKQILGMVVLGFSNADIASKLYLAPSTVKSHLSSAFMKLGVRSRSEAAALILDAESGLGMGILGISNDTPSSLEPAG
jgi:DNA-binding NarL/FixJ family response regulator